MARAEPAGARGHPARRHAAGRSTWGAPGWESVDAERARSATTTSSSRLSAAKARAKIVEQLRESGDLVGEPRPITHAVKFYEKGDRPLEIVTSRQWFIKTIEFREALLARGRELQWHPAVHAGALRELDQRPERRLVRQPPAVLRRAVSGLVSARRATAASITTGRSPRARIGCRSIRRPTCPPATAPSSAAQPGGFVGDPDVMDTWATSSLTPQIVCGWPDDPDLFARTFPMDLRPQAHDIIRTWLFDTVLRAHLEHDSLPWTNAAISGLGARSRSQEDVEVEGQRRHADGAARGARLRRRALLGGERPAGHRHGVRPEPDEGRPAAGDQAAERVEVRARRAPSRRGRSPRPVDRAMLRNLAALVDEATEAFEGYDYARVLQRTETFFWRFCDDYLELVKGRRYGEQGADGGRRRPTPRSPRRCRCCCGCSRRSCRSSPKKCGRGGRRDRFTRRRGRRAAELDVAARRQRRGRRAQADQAAYEWATDVLFEVRKQRSEAKQPLKVPITKVTVTADADARRADAASSRPTCEPALRVQAFETQRRRAARDSSSRATKPPTRPLDALDRRTATSSAARSTKTSARGDITTDATVAADAARPRRRSSPRRDCVARRPRRRVRSVPAARSRRRRSTFASTTATRCAPGDVIAEVVGSARTLLDRRAHGAQLPAAPVRHRDARRAGSSTPPAAASPSSTRARRRRRCGRWRSTPSRAGGGDESPRRACSTRC